MRKESKEFIEYLQRTKGISKNTEISYKGDLDKMIEYFNMRGIFDSAIINETNLNSYILYLELKGNSNATITRNIVVLKGYFDFLFKTHRIQECITDNVKRPVIEKNVIAGTSKREIDKILIEVEGDTPKALRDNAIIQLFSKVGIQVSELIMLELSDVNLSVGYIQCTSRKKKKTYSLPDEVVEVLGAYLENGRPSLVKENENTILFVNMQGDAISRQGVWKMVKRYATQAGAEGVNSAKLCRASET